jgi:PadR family transcriptional regulator PadR
MTSSRPLGSLQQAILLLLWSDEYYGLEIQRRLRFQGKNVGPGQLYPALRRLEDQGYVKSKEVSRVGANRVYYSITEIGKSTVIEKLMEVLYVMRYISIDFLNPYLDEAVQKTDIRQGETILDLSSPVMEKLRMKTTELHKPNGRYLLVNTNPIFSDLLSEWIRSEKRELVDLLDMEQVERLEGETVDIVLALFNITEINVEWTIEQALRLLRKGGKLVICDIAAREEDTIRDDLYKEYMPTQGKSGISLNIDKELTEKGMKVIFFEKKRGLITGIFQKKSNCGRNDNFFYEIKKK